MWSFIKCLKEKNPISIWARRYLEPLCQGIKAKLGGKLAKVSKGSWRMRERQKKHSESSSKGCRNFMPITSFYFKCLVAGGWQSLQSISSTNWLKWTFPTLGLISLGRDSGLQCKPNTTSHARVLLKAYKPKHPPTRSFICPDLGFWSFSASNCGLLLPRPPVSSSLPISKVLFFFPSLYKILLILHCIDVNDIVVACVCCSARQEKRRVEPGDSEQRLQWRLGLLNLLTKRRSTPMFCFLTAGPTMTFRFLPSYPLSALFAFCILYTYSSSVSPLLLCLCRDVTMFSIHP